MSWLQLRAASGYEDFKYDISVDGTTGFTFLAREPGVIQTAEQPTLVADAAVTDTGALTVWCLCGSTRISGRLSLSLRIHFLSSSQITGDIYPNSAP